jgi:four helix bundle protein
MIEQCRAERVLRGHDRMEQITSYRDLLAWQRAIVLADFAYEITKAFPKREWWGLASQMRKSAVSIPSNIAEGHRRNIAGYCHHLMISLGSHAELETQAVIGKRREYISGKSLERFDELSSEVGRLTHGLLRSLEASAVRGPAPNP